MSEGFPLRKERAKSTKARLYKAAAELFATHGYRGTSVDRIVALAGVAKGTFFLHFPAKEAVITELVREQVNAALAARLAAVPEGPLFAIRAAVVTLGEHAAGNRTLSRAVLAAMLESPEVGGATMALIDGLHSLVLADAVEASRRGFLLPTVRADVFATSMMTAYFGAVVHWCASPRAMPLSESIGLLVDTQLAGHCRPECLLPERGHTHVQPTPRAKARKPRLTDR
jgi:AcrR family transcriptional regulator